MKLKKLTYTLTIASLLFAGCTETNTDTSAPATTPEETSPSTSTEPTDNPMNVKSNQSTPEAKEAREKFEKQKEQITAEQNNITSNYKYITTTEEYSIFASLVKKSTVGKYMHSAEVAVLAPKNRAFDDYPNYLNLTKPGNEAALDKFVSSYILSENVSYKVIKEAKTVDTYSGESQKVNDRGGITVGGASISTDEAFTQNGTVLGMNELYYVPEEMK